MGELTLMRDLQTAFPGEETAPIRQMQVRQADYADGTVTVDVTLEESVYYQILSDYSGLSIDSEYTLMGMLKEYAGIRAEYEKTSHAMDDVRRKGYSVLMPGRDEIVLDDPEVIRHGNKFGVKIRAQAPSVNLIRAVIETELAPIVGDEKQAEDLIAYIKENSRESKEGVWSTSIFGKSIEQIVMDGMEAKIAQMTDSCQQKLQDTLQKIINDSNGGMVCIII